MSAPVIEYPPHVSYTPDALRLHEEILRHLSAHAYAILVLLAAAPGGGTVSAPATVSLAASPATTTTIVDASIVATSMVLLTPKNQAAAAAVPASWVTYAAGVATIHHPPSGVARDFVYVIAP